MLIATGISLVVYPLLFAIGPRGAVNPKDYWVICVFMIIMGAYGFWVEILLEKAKNIENDRKRFIRGYVKNLSRALQIVAFPLIIAPTKWSWPISLIAAIIWTSLFIVFEFVVNHIVL